MRLYCARPMTCYGTDLDARQLARVAEAFPDAEVLDPASMFDTNEQWLAAWPEVLASLDLLVLWADEDGFVGAGVFREVVDAMAARVPVVALDHEGTLRTFGGLHCYGMLPSRARVGELVYGDVLDVAAVTVAVRIGQDMRAVVEKVTVPHLATA